LSISNKLLNQKFGKDELARRLEQSEERILRKNAELLELQHRFEDHLNSANLTEQTLYSRIDDLQQELNVVKALREED